MVNQQPRLMSNRQPITSNQKPSTMPRFTQQHSRGSVLILVVAVLVLLALIGTAYISTTRTDVFTSQQHTFNTQIDLLMDGVEAMVTAAIVDDMLDTGKGRYNASVSDLFLGSRVPSLRRFNDGTTNYDFVVWDDFTFPLVLNPTSTTPVMPAYQFESPFETTPLVLAEQWTAGKQYQRGDRVFTVDNGRLRFWYADQTHTSSPGDMPQPNSMIWAAVEPKSELYLAPTATATGAPGLRLYHVDSAGGTAGTARARRATTLYAADTDGDGIADSGLVRLTEINGITYYKAVRIIDNAAAVNVNTAYDSEQEFRLNGITAADGALDQGFTPASIYEHDLGMFRSHVGLRQLLRTTATQNVDGQILNVRNHLAGPGGAGATPINDDGSPRSEFAFGTWGHALEMMLARRLENPGLQNQSSRYSPYGIGGAAALASRFSLINPTVSPSEIEDELVSVYDLVDNHPSSGTPMQNRRRYDARDVARWFDFNFNYDSVVLNPLIIPGLPNGQLNLGQQERPVRALTTTYNPVSQASPSYFAAPTGGNYNFGSTFVAAGRRYGALVDIANTAQLGDPTQWTELSWIDRPMRANVNTAGFGELWLAYWGVMKEDGGATPFGFTGNETDPYLGTRFNWNAPYPPDGVEHPQRMFRSSLRDPRIDINLPGWLHFPAVQQMRLRAALAAINTIALREQDRIPPSRRIRLQAVDENNNPIPVDVRVFGAAPQPYITEVYADTFVARNNDGYVAVELHNPHDFALDISGYQLYVVHRENRNDANNNINAYPVNGLAFDFIGELPPGTTIPAGGYLVLVNTDDINARPPWVQPGGTVVPNLHRVMADQRTAPPRRGGELLIVRSHRDESGQEILPTSPLDGAPVDSYDFTHLVLQEPNPGEEDNYRYIHYARESGQGQNWRFVYPGRYMVRDDDLVIRHQGTEYNVLATATGSPPAQIVPANISLGAGSAATYPTSFTIQMAATAFAGPNPLLNPQTGNPSGVAAYPFGGFMRDGDILKVPFIGAYVVARDNFTRLLEANATSIDSTFAEDTDTANDNLEDIGRFAPIFDPAGTVMDDRDLNPYGSYLATTQIEQWRYRWAMDLFDYVTVDAPQDAWLPNVERGLYIDAAQPAPTAVRNQPAGVANGREDELAAAHGKININTAPWRVLATLPWVAPVQTTDASGVQPRARIVAQGIADWRDGVPIPFSLSHGPFESLFDLYRVPAFRQLQRDIITAAGNPDNRHGDFSPITGNDGVTGDFEERFLLLTRLSNLLTTRSDGYTVYILLQGWRNAGTADAELVVQRRRAFLIDRSFITDTNRNPRRTMVVTD